MTFEEAVTRLAVDGGVKLLLTIPGVWEHVSESYNNDAIDLMNRMNEGTEEEEEETTTYKVHGYCDDEDGDTFQLGTVIVEAEDEQDAEQQAWDELWDSRLTGASCKFRVSISEHIEEDEEEEEDEDEA